MVLQCVRCIASHGEPGCAATHETETGEPSCTWHLDGELCPIEQKQQRAARKGNPPDETPPATSDENSTDEVKSEGTMSETRGNGTETAPKKICVRPGCTVALSSENTCGRCRAHVRWQDRTRSAGNGHAPAGSNGSHAAANGSAKKTTNGNGHSSAPAGSNGAAAVVPELAADRVDQLLATLTAGDKARLALAWLRGTL